MIRPLTSIGLITLPTSSTIQYPITCVLPVSGSISTSQIGEIAAVGAIGGGLIEAGFHAGPQLVQLERRLRHLVKAHGAVGAGDGEAAVLLELDVALGRFREMRGELLALSDNLVVLTPRATQTP